MYGLLAQIAEIFFLNQVDFVLPQKIRPIYLLSNLHKANMEIQNSQIMMLFGM